MPIQFPGPPLRYVVKEDAMSTAPARKADPFDAVSFAREVLRHEGESLVELSQAVCRRAFTESIDLILGCSGRVIVSGMGKAGLIGAKLSATFSSTGTCAHFVHPGEAFHGDLGRFHETDVAVILSRSGETEEIVKILPSLLARTLPIIAITAKPRSSLGTAASTVLDIGGAAEAGELGLAPSTSTTLMLGVGDALALTVSKLRGFQVEDFARFHPGGSLGRQLTKVNEMMRPLAECRVSQVTCSVRDVVANQHPSGRRTGAAMLVDDQQFLRGIFTDSDLARMLTDPSCDLDCPVADVMTSSPKTVDSGQTISQAIETLGEYQISELPVVNPDGSVVGLVDITDLIGHSSSREHSSASEPARHQGDSTPILRITHPDSEESL